MKINSTNDLIMKILTSTILSVFFINHNWFDGF
ncbi:hypothetical protein CLU83_2965 [Flavobacterium sp. 1]|nr:hypothetical protein CLU83_2965 [Flavobacterium sp. 1]